MNGTDPVLLKELFSCELFETLSEEEIASIADLAQVKNYEAGETIYEQGDRGNELYIIKSGQVSLQRCVNIGERKATASIGILGRGRAFGCSSALLGEAHELMTSALCAKPTQVIVLNGTALRTILQTNVKVGFKVMERFAYVLRERLRGTYGAMEKIV